MGTGRRSANVGPSPLFLVSGFEDLGAERAQNRTVKKGQAFAPNLVTQQWACAEWPVGAVRGADRQCPAGRRTGANRTEHTVQCKVCRPGGGGRQGAASTHLCRWRAGWESLQGASSSWHSLPISPLSGAAARFMVPYFCLVLSRSLGCWQDVWFLALWDLALAARCKHTVTQPVTRTMPVTSPVSEE